MRPILFGTIGLSLALSLGLSACATRGGHPSYNDELKTLDADCVARGGILTPSGLQTGRAQTDYVCKITGGASRLSDRD